MEVVFETGEGGIEHFPARHDHDIKTGRDLVTPEDLAGAALGEVSLHRRSHLSRGRYPEAGPRPAVGQYEQGHELTVNPGALCVDALELRPAPDALGCCQ